MFSYLLIETCFQADLLRQIVVSLTVSFFVGFRVDSSNDKVLSKVNISNLVRQYVVNV